MPASRRVRRGADSGTERPRGHLTPAAGRVDSACKMARLPLPRARRLRHQCRGRVRPPPTFASASPIVAAQRRGVRVERRQAHGLCPRRRPSGVPPAPAPGPRDRCPRRRRDRDRHRDAAPVEAAYAPRVVIVVGPSGGATRDYLGKAREYAAQAKAYGASVTSVLTPARDVGSASSPPPRGPTSSSTSATGTAGPADTAPTRGSPRTASASTRGTAPATRGSSTTARTSSGRTSASRRAPSSCSTGCAMRPATPSPARLSRRWARRSSARTTSPPASSMRARSPWSQTGTRASSTSWTSCSAGVRPCWAHGRRTRTRTGTSDPSLPGERRAPPSAWTRTAATRASTGRW